MRSNKKSENIASFPAPNSVNSASSQTDLVSFAQGDLGKIQDILLGAPTQQIDKRLQEMEANFESRVATMEKKFTLRLDQLMQADAEKVSQAKLAKILSALADEVPDK